MSCLLEAKSSSNIQISCTSPDYLGRPLTSYNPLEWGGRIFAYCQDQGANPISPVNQPVSGFTFNLSSSLMANLTSPWLELPVTRLILNCALDWQGQGDTALTGRDVAKI